MTQTSVAKRDAPMYQCTDKRNAINAWDGNDEGDADLAEDDLVDRGNQIKQSMLGIESSTAD